MENRSPAAGVGMSHTARLVRCSGSFSIVSAVIGVLHPELGEGVVAVVVPEPGARLDTAGLVGALKDRIAGFKVPKQVFIVDDLPRNAMGKVLKAELRRTYGETFKA